MITPLSFALWIQNVIEVYTLIIIAIYSCSDKNITEKGFYMYASVATGVFLPPSAVMVKTFASFLISLVREFKKVLFNNLGLAIVIFMQFQINPIISQYYVLIIDSMRFLQFLSNNDLLSVIQIYLHFI